MRIVPRAALGLLACLLASAVAAQNFSGKPFLSVQGHAEAKVKPDIFPITVTILDTGMDAGKSQEVVENLAAQVVSAASALGVADGDLQVGNLGISTETRYDEKTEKEVFLGNTYERKIQARFHDLDGLRKFIAAVPAVKQVHLETDNFEFSGAAELKRKLRRAAIEDAKKGAQDMASAVGKKLLDLFNVSDRAQSTLYAASGYEGYGLETVTVYGSAIGPRRAQIVLKEGEITVKADAFLVYLIGD
jgi:uncharacterized protein